eukprot:TRINITY_DN1532_c0_g1_i2.p1 TRINITY_DN1532_c0_g1~~TRINITY_DN1532_c0_g1_i2.p1  ORF type:complete len:283 (+),score=79.28 TRINITY_DN1532_c0_g1_i2:75-851(+)
MCIRDRYMGIASPSVLPLWKVKCDASWGGYANFTNLTIVNFKNEGDCRGSSAFTSNSFASDETIVHFISKINVTNVTYDRLFNFDRPNPSWRTPDDCGDWDCTGLYNILVKNTDGSLANGSSTPLSFVPTSPFKTWTDDCTFNSKWEGYSCSTLDYGLLEFESLDSDKRTRLPSPINITSSNGFINSLNTFMDHVWHGFYTGLVRLNRYPSIVQLNKYYNVNWTGTIPNTVRFQLRGANSPQDYVIVNMQYTLSLIHI